MKAKNIINKIAENDMFVWAKNDNPNAYGSAVKNIYHDVERYKNYINPIKVRFSACILVVVRNDFTNSVPIQTHSSLEIRPKLLLKSKNGVYYNQKENGKNKRVYLSQAVVENVKVWLETQPSKNDVYVHTEEELNNEWFRKGLEGLEE